MQTDRQAAAGKQTGRQADRQTSRQADKQSDRHKSNIARQLTDLQHIADNGIVGLGLEVGSQSQRRQCVGGHISGKQAYRQTAAGKQTGTQAVRQTYKNPI